MEQHWVAGFVYDELMYGLKDLVRDVPHLERQEIVRRLTELIKKAHDQAPVEKRGKKG